MSTQDRAVEAHHDDWDRHWDDYAAAAERNPAQRYRRRVALDLLEAEGAPLRLLDVGSGLGDFLAVAARRWPSAALLGLEPSAVGVRRAQAKVPAARFVCGDLTAGADVPGDLERWATHAVCSEVLEHVDDDVALLAAATRLMAPGCRLVVTVPGGRMSAFDRHIGHRRHYTPRSLAATLRAAGYAVETTTGAGFPFFNLYRRLVIARGAALVDDVRTGAGEPTGLARVAMAGFGPLFRLNAPSSPWGVQIVGVARVAGAAAPSSPRTPARSASAPT
ncbi:MAG TPA: class I SAM-dependent methyltransferase [Baekduia sp.]|uniref:class I SAM-dependent methyltransferase n=1 Tax=Baekduia sp. TaxID=2600305 RepID=UPI002D7772E2|nr:class I SAM-dependent methyltransferase [Baekduia sp.]HET6509512.1 class I SAM-dependent methyltransferase [Baekduia sp.]